ncbi:hypothetical protein ABVK62_09050 [Bacillus subtilis]|uniref:hypothetical protein n=1 Tax=Bacillus subtilis TaxID=1423 RepID=UPI00345B6C7A
MIIIPNEFNFEQENVLEAFVALAESIQAEEEKIADKIGDYAKAKDWDAVTKESERGQRMKQLEQQVLALKEEYTRISLIDEIGEGNAEPLTAIERTKWELQGDKIRVETETGGTPYSNVIPVSLFKEIANCALYLIEQSEFVKTSEVFKIMSNKIINQSAYKKAPKLPVYVTFKVLAKEGLFKTLENNSRKYELGSSKAKIEDWLNTLG